MKSKLSGLFNGRIGKPLPNFIRELSTDSKSNDFVLFPGGKNELLKYANFNIFVWETIWLQLGVTWNFSYAFGF